MWTLPASRAGGRTLRLPGRTSCWRKHIGVIGRAQGSPRSLSARCSKKDEVLGPRLGTDQKRVVFTGLSSFPQY